MVGRNILENNKVQNYIFLAPSKSELNLLDINSVEKYIESNKPDIIIHCAGLVGGIQANISNPVKFLTENFDIGKNVLISANKYKVPRVLNLASSCIYPKDMSGHLTEQMILTGPLEPTNEGYALAKISILKLCEYINRENKNLNFKTIIPCNLYGRWDKFSDHNSHMLPAVIKKIHKAKVENIKDVEIWGTGQAKREFMYCSDLVDFIFYALENWTKIPELVNVGLGEDYTINEYYSKVAHVIGYEGEFKHDLTKPEGMKRKVLDISSLRDLNWKAKTDLENGIRNTYSFYLERMKNDISTGNY